MAVRVDRDGRLMRDYHTAQNVRRADPSKGTQDTMLSERFYLADADFLVGLQGEHTFLKQLEDSLRQPVWTLFLGRKSFIPALPIVPALPDLEAVVDGTLTHVLEAVPWHRQRLAQKAPKTLRGIIEVDFGNGEPRQDVPLSFVSRDRRFGLRHVDPNYPFNLTPNLIRDPR
jgi:CRISPR system Cascade subunit CasD